MKSKEGVMESGDDYDQMLRAMFESCDTVGLGLLTPKDFEKLCKKLSMQEHSSLLADVLFPDTSKRKLLSYETFRDTLILFLTGDTGFEKCSTGDDKNTHANPEDSWNNNSGEHYNENRMDSLPRAEIISEEVFTMDANENCDNNSGVAYNGNSPDSQKKYRRYGRKSKPDWDLLSSRESGETERSIVLREVQVDSTRHLGFMDESSPENSPWKAVEVSFASEQNPTPIVMKDEEEFSGNGNDETWKNPDSEWMCDLNANVEDSPHRGATVKDVQTELELTWSRVVGNPIRDAMNESQLGSLCAELGLGNISRSEDIAELFDALDGDNDGLVTFHEFSEQMSVFLNCDDANPAEPDDDRRTPGHELPDYVNTSQDFVLSTSDIIEEGDDELSRREEYMTTQNDDVRCENVTPRPQTPVDIADAFESAIDFKPAKSTPTAKDYTSSPAQSVTSSEGSQTPRSRGRLSLDNDTSPLCPPVVSVEPRQLAAINRGRRRRRSSAVAASNPAGVRQQRRKSARSIPLPHYHPTSIRKLEELPLSYLTEEHERYISLDSLRQSWEQEGLEDSSAVLEALELSSTEQSVSVEALSEVLEMEFEQNLLQKAALILYKRGINHYRSLYDHERAERSKQESNIEHLVSQLHEQEERIETAESNFREKAEEMETKYKMEIRALTDELVTAQARIRESEQQSSASREEEFSELTEKYEKSQGFLEELRRENEKLSKEKEEAESRLMDAEDAMMKMQEDLDVACRGIALSNRQLASQRKQYVDLLRVYEDQSQSLQDSNDELFDRLQQSRRRWSSPSRSKSQSTRRKIRSSSPMLRNNSDTSSYSSASEEPYHLSTGQLFVNDSPQPMTSREQFMTSSPTAEAHESKGLVTSNAFAFLTPSTSHAKSRVQSYASLAIVPPTLSLENRSNL